MSPESIIRLPCHAQVENVIVGSPNNSLSHGARLPSEDNLVQEYAVSRNEPRTVIQSLVQRELTPLAQTWDLRK